MASNISDTLQKAGSYLSLERRAAIYTERAHYYWQRAIIESLKGGALVDLESGSKLVDIVNTTAITLYTGEKIELAQNAESLYFARIQGCKYYPINIELSQDLLKQAERYEQLSQSLWRRLLREPYELLWGELIFKIYRSLYDINDGIFQLYLPLERMAQERQVPEELEGLQEFKDTLRKLSRK